MTPRQRGLVAILAAAVAVMAIVWGGPSSLRDGEEGASPDASSSSSGSAAGSPPSSGLDLYDLGNFAGLVTARQCDPINIVHEGAPALSGATVNLLELDDCWHIAFGTRDTPGVYAGGTNDDDRTEGVLVTEGPQAIADRFGVRAHVFYFGPGSGRAVIYSASELFVCFTINDGGHALDLTTYEIVSSAEGGCPEAPLAPGSVHKLDCRVSSTAAASDDKLCWRVVLDDRQLMTVGGIGDARSGGLGVGIPAHPAHPTIHGVDYSHVRGADLDGKRSPANIYGRPDIYHVSPTVVCFTTPESDPGAVLLLAQGPNHIVALEQAPDCPPAPR